MKIRKNLSTPIGVLIRSWDIPDEWLETLSAEEYWIEEYDVSDESIREENFDMREGVFDAILHFFEFGGA